MSHTPEPWHNKTDKDNAHLIAAASELLESLKEMVADLLSHAELGMSEREVDMLRRAQAAITKAEAT